MIALIMLEWMLVFGFTPSSPIVFHDYGDDRHAMCFHDYKRIIVNSNHWDTLPYVHQRELIFHELLHCECDARHVDYPDIMRPVVYDTLLDGSNWKRLLTSVKERGECKWKVY